MTEPNDELAAPPTPSDREPTPAPTPAPVPATRPTAPATPSSAPATPPTAPASALPMLVGRRQFARTTPVVVDRGRASFGLPSIGDRRQAGQIGLVILMIAALGAILLARSGTPPASGIADGGSPSPLGSLIASPPTSPRPSPPVSPAPSASAPRTTPKPSPTARPKTYVVKSGDTLSGIASRNHTTVKAIIHLNGLKAPYVIHPGQVLKLP